LVILGGGCDGVGWVFDVGVVGGGGSAELVADVGECSGDGGGVAKAAPAR